VEKEKCLQQQQEQEIADERDKEKMEEAPTTTAAPLPFDPRAGEVADQKQNPLMRCPNEILRERCRLPKRIW
jgi:hypothetical protein